MELYEVLTEVFGIDEEEAMKANSKHSLQDFEKNFSRLEGIVGFEVAVAAVRLGEFLGYKNSHLERYFSLVNNLRNELSGKYGSNGTEPLLRNKEAFYSVGSLESALTEDDGSVDNACGMNSIVHLHKLLHKRNENSRRYLNFLIGQGYLEVGENEHWTVSDRDTNQRGRNILKIIRSQLNHVFSELGYEKPQIEINFGQHKLTIGNHAKSKLVEIRDRAYKLQK